MDCPKCGFQMATAAAECPRCGIVIAKYERAHEDVVATVNVSPLREVSRGVAGEPANESAARRERMARAIALPLALLFALFAVKVAPGPVRMLSMWVHESGHATAAWLCGYL